MVAPPYRLTGTRGEYPVIGGSKNEVCKIVQINVPNGCTERRKKRDRCKVICAGVGEQMMDAELVGVRKCNAWIDEQSS